MAYKKTKGRKSNDGFRLRASFLITPELTVSLNQICEAENITFAAACKEAVVLYVSGYKIDNARAV